MSQNNGRFTKGDPRINRKGRPRSFDELRTLAQKIAREIVTNNDGTKRTVIENILRRMAVEEPKLFVEIAYGKVPRAIDVTGGLDLKVLKVVTYDYAAASRAICADEEEDEEGDRQSNHPITEDASGPEPNH